MFRSRKYIPAYDAEADLPMTVQDGSLANVAGVLYKKTGGVWGAFTVVPAGSLALALQTGLELTLDTNGDAVKTADEGHFKIDTFADAASDTFRKLTGGAAGDVVWLHPANDARSVIIEHDATTADEFRCPGGEDITLAEDTDYVVCVHDGTGWVVVAVNTLEKNGFALSGKATAATLLTVAAGVITRTQMVHKVAGQGAAADDLDTVTGAEVDGVFTLLRPSSDAVDITVKHGTGNIECAGATDIVMAEDDDFVLLLGNGTKASVVGRKTKAKSYVHTADLYLISATPGVEGAGSANSIDIVVAITDLNGVAVAVARQVVVHSLAVTADKGDLAAATTPVGTLKKAVNPGAGENVAWFETTSGGLFSVKVSNDVAEETMVEIHAEGCRPKLVKLTFA